MKLWDLLQKYTRKKALNMTLFEVTLPEKEKSDTRGFKELLASMEQFFSGMQAVGMDVIIMVKIILP